MKIDYKIILASQSPRRRELLSQIGVEFEVIPSMADENIKENNPSEFVKKLALIKGEEVYNRIKKNENILVIGADTIVVKDKVLGKPADREEAISMIKNISGTSHEVYTGVSFYLYNESTKEEKVDVIINKTKVNVCDINIEEIEEYVDSKDPFDKAGGYGIQGSFAKYISSIEGDYYNVVGLPVSDVYQKIKDLCEK